MPRPPSNDDGLVIVLANSWSFFMQAAHDDMHRTCRESRLVLSLAKLQDKLQDLDKAKGDDEFEQWQATWNQQSRQIEEQLKLIQSQLESQTGPTAPGFSIVGGDSNERL